MKDVHAPTPRQAPRRHGPGRVPLFTLLGVVGLLATACGGSEEPAHTPGPESQEIHLQPVGAPGPDPFTASSATGESAPVQPPLPNQSGKGIRTVNAATPGLYGGTQRLGSCDIEQQASFLTADTAKAGAFAQASGIEQEKITEFLRGLTPVVLRADTRVTSHGFRDGRANGFQSVLQAGSAVLVDNHGMPRVRCGGGNPLAAPLSPKGSPVLKGDQWNGYQPNQVIVIEPTATELAHLVIVNLANNTWLERRTGDDGAQDKPPAAAPPFDPADGIPAGPITPEVPAADGSATGPSAPAEAAPQAPSVPGSDVPPGVPQDAPTGPEAQNPSDLPPGSPSDVPPGSPSELPPDVPPGTPFDVPSDVPQGTPFDVPSEVPQDQPYAPPPGDPALPADPGGPLPDQLAPYGPSDAPAAPEPPLQPAGPGGNLESA